MAVDVIMPAMGATQETGRLVRWLKREGDSVARGEMLMEVETDKSVVEVEAAASGILARVTAAPDDDVPVGRTIALIVEPGESLPPSEGFAPPVGKAAKTARAGAASRKAGQSPSAAPAAPAARPGAARLLASPAARRLAQERGVTLAGVRGSGPGGALVARDVLSAAPDTAPGEAAPAPVPPSRMRRLIGERMTLSKQTTPHFYLNMDVDMTAVESRRAALTPQASGSTPSINDFILRAAAQALAESPSMNAAWTDAGIRRYGEVHLCVAVAVDDGLVAPVIRHADKLGLDALAQRSRELARRARDRRLRPADCEGGTFTVSNLGAFGVDSFTAIINPPQSAILAAGRVAPRVVPHGGAIAVRPMMTLTLSADHRVVDGAAAARFLQRVRQRLEEDRAGETSTSRPA